MTTHDLGVITDEELVIQWAIHREAEHADKERRERVEVELERRMRERGATAILHPFFDVRLETPYSLDAEALRPLAELIPPEEWERGFSEAHEETIQVPAKADLRVVKGWIKFGAAIAERIEQAKVAGLPRLRVTAKK